MGLQCGQLLWYLRKCMIPSGVYFWNFACQSTSYAWDIGGGGRENDSLASHTWSWILGPRFLYTILSSLDFFLGLCVPNVSRYHCFFQFPWHSTMKKSTITIFFNMLFCLPILAFIFCLVVDYKPCRYLKNCYSFFCININKTRGELFFVIFNDEYYFGLNFITPSRIQK